MPGLMVESLDETTLARLQALAEMRQTTAQALAGRLLAEAMGVTERQAWAEEIRALRRSVGPDPVRDSVAILRAEREARAARIGGEDETEVWAAVYRAAL